MSAADPMLPSGSPKCQCAACGLYFKSSSAFDAHRYGPYTERLCLTTEELLSKGMEPSETGHWRFPYVRP